MAGTLDALRPEPHRGDTVAAGAVVLATAVYVIETRFAGVWGPGIRLVVDALATLLVAALAVQSPVEGERPRAYQSVLFVATFFLVLATLVNLADVLGADNPPNASGTIVWIGALLAGLCAWFATRRNSAVMTLLGAVSFGFVVEAFVAWVFSPHGETTFRWILVLLVLGFAVASLGQRGARPRHAVQMVNAAGLGAVGLGLTFADGVLFNGLGSLFGRAAGAGAGTGWELFLLACAFGLIAYSGVDREPGPAYLGVLVLALFVSIAGPKDHGASLIGWPILLVIMASVMLAVGLRPSRPLPPSPDAGHPEPPPPAPIPVPPPDPPTTQMGSEDPTEVQRP